MITMMFDNPLFEFGYHSFLLRLEVSKGDYKNSFFFIYQKADTPDILLFLLYLFSKSIHHTWFSYHLKPDIKTIPTIGITLPYDIY